MNPLPLPNKLSEADAFFQNNRAALCRDPQQLQCTPALNASQKAIRVRLLSLIGSPQALDVLTRYRPQPDALGLQSEGFSGETFSAPVCKEIIRAWNAFDRRVFAHTMFSNINHGGLHLNNGGAIASIDGIEAAQNTVQLALDLHNTCNLAPLAHCQTLRALKLHLQKPRHGLAALPQIPHLGLLEISNGTQLAQNDFEQIARIPKLQALDIALNPSLCIEPLCKAPQLRWLKISIGDTDTDPAHVPFKPLLQLAHRGCRLLLYTHQPWVESFAQQIDPAWQIAKHGLLAISSDPQEHDDLETLLEWGGKIETACPHLLTLTPPDSQPASQPTSQPVS